MNFQDHFSSQSDLYLRARPSYPDELFVFLQGISPSRKLCWDCATGNGQAAIALSRYFERVIATDASERQIANAITTENIEYRVGTAEQSGLRSNSVDLITVATAAHWFDHDLFYAEANRVAAPNGILAVWTYSEARISGEIDALMEWFMYEFLHDYWPDGRWYVRNKYATLPFPYNSLPTPDFFCKVVWNKEQWLNYIRSWSSYNQYLSKQQRDPLEILLPKLNLLWKGDDSKNVVWPLHLKCARLNQG